MSIFFTSDTHFYHKAIIGYCNRLGGGVLNQPADVQVATMNQLLIERWNEKITNDDEVYFLGDFAFCGTQKAVDVIKQLRGRKYWIRGNHDYSLSKKDGVKEHFEWIKDYYMLHVHDKYQPEDEDEEIKQYHQEIVLCHFPILSWDGMARGAWHLHGHCHGSLGPDIGLRMDVGVDTNSLSPYSYTDIKQRLVLKTVVPVDHHRPKE